MKRIVYTALLLGAAPALAQTQPAAGPTSAVDSTSAAHVSPANRVICQRIEEIGSRLGGKRVCMTQQQWEEQRRHNREDVEEARRHRGS